MRPATGEADRHTIHSYFNTSPESPDGRWILFFASTAADAHQGEIRVADRVSGREKVIARNVTTEDAHRAACQQWVSGGRRVAFHDVRDGEWLVAVVDVETLKERVLARGRQLCWGQPGGHLVPIYGPHWNPGPHRDLELLNVETGEIKKVVTADAVKATYPKWIADRFGERPASIFFPVLSPDSKRVFFKMATPAGGDFRSRQASDREGLVCYDLEEKRFLFLQERWGHPSWHPEGHAIVEKRGQLIDVFTGESKRTPNWPAVSGDHPSASTDGRLVTTDTVLEAFGGTRSQWGIVVADIKTGEHQIIHRFENNRGANSWRRSHPHPTWSADGKRIYFNVSSGKWTQLFVAEAAASSPMANALKR